MRTIQIRLSNEDYERLVLASAQEDRTESSIAAMGIHRYVDELLGSSVPAYEQPTRDL